MYQHFNFCQSYLNFAPYDQTIQGKKFKVAFWNILKFLGFVSILHEDFS